MADELDIVIYGASGFTGQQAVKYLERRAEDLPLRWAIAGRDPDKLSDLAAGMTDPPEVVVALADDRVALTALARRSAVVINVAGPYVGRAEGLVASCIAGGAHYLDLTGECAYTRQLIDTYQASAVDAGVKLIPSCGFESIPFDLGVLSLDESFRADDGSNCLNASATLKWELPGGLTRGGSGASGGTIATIAKFAEPSDKYRLTDQFVLVSDDLLVGATRTGASPAYDLKARRDEAGAWLAPLMPSPFVNPPVIHRSNALLARDGRGFAIGFTYSEALDVSASLGTGLIAGPVARAASALIDSIVRLSQRAGTRRDRIAINAMKRFGPSPGKGPKEKAIDGFNYSIEIDAISDTGRTRGVTIVAHGNPGYRSTPNMIVEAAIALSGAASFLPERSGFLTPATGLGLGFIDELVHAGVIFRDRPGGGSTLRAESAATRRIEI